ncbi:MAG: single-stranded DNA-binding protein [Mycoplasmatota bacterium]|nr:single-stranded DNA-binding protein [Mycoplasmatota bacterium]
MLNQVILVGRLVRNPELQLTESGKKISVVTLAVNRAFKNTNGEYDTDFFDCTLWTNVAENTAEYCRTGDVIGVKGRLQTRIVEKEDGNKFKRTEIVAERVTFLSSAEKLKDEDNSVDRDTKKLDNVLDNTNVGENQNKNDKKKK